VLILQDYQTPLNHAKLSGRRECIELLRKALNVDTPADRVSLGVAGRQVIGISGPSSSSLCPWLHVSLPFLFSVASRDPLSSLSASWSCQINHVCVHENVQGGATVQQQPVPADWHVEPGDFGGFILSHCTPKELGRLACVSKAWKEAAGSDEAWRRSCGWMDGLRVHFPELQSATGRRDAFTKCVAGVYSPDGTMLVKANPYSGKHLRRHLTPTNTRGLAFVGSTLTNTRALAFLGQTPTNTKGLAFLGQTPTNTRGLAFLGQTLSNKSFMHKGC
jgi:hypothetical protein